MQAYIELVDDMPQQNIIDYTVKSHGHIIMHFLLSTNCCIVNGPGTSDDFTSVSIKGLAVVDYFEFTATRPRDAYAISIWLYVKTSKTNDVFQHITIATI